MAHSELSEAEAMKPQRVFLMTYPRTASNLLLKILALDEQLNTQSNDLGGYYFRPAFLKSRMTGSPYRQIGRLNDHEVHEMKLVFQECLDSLERDSRQAIDQGKNFFAKEHCLWLFNPVSVSTLLGEQNSHPESSFRVQEQSTNAQNLSSSELTWSLNNETVLPDEYLRTWRLAFLIRHPGLAFPSFYRAVLKLQREGYVHESELWPHLQENFTLRWSRMLYDWSCDQGNEPPVLDADDIIGNQAVVISFCENIGIDPSQLKFSWESKTQECLEEKEPKRSLASIMEETLWNSTGALKEKSSDSIDIHVEHKKWKEEFGQEVSTLLEGSVRAAMPDYEYLRARRLKCQSL